MATAATVVPQPGPGTESGQPSPGAGQAAGGTAPAPAEKATTTAQPPAVAPPAVPGTEGFDEEFKNLDPALQTQLKKILTAKFQAAAEKAKAADERAAALGNLASLVEMAKAGRAKDVIQVLAQQAGVKVSFADEAKPGAPADPVAARLHEALANALGDDAAASIAPVLLDSFRQTVAPIQEQTLRAAGEAVVERYFAAKPDAAKYRDKITDLSKIINPAPGAGLTPEAWLDHLYTLASAADREAAGATKVLEALKVSAGAGGGPTNGARAADVTTVQPGDDKKTMVQLIKEAAVDLARRR